MLEIRELTYQELEQSPGFEETVTEYAAETANEAIGTPKIQRSRYRELSSLGKIQCLGAFEGDKVVGLAVVFFSQSQHYPFPIASIESFYLRKDYRKGGNGLGLLHAVKHMVKAEGAPGLVFMAPPGSTYAALCAKLGMTHTHNAYWCKV